jgi:hypothetical protein
MRVGRTNDLRRRELEHRRDPVFWKYDFQPDMRTDNYAAQRGREQVLHDLHRPPLDKINPIDPKNPRRQFYLDAAAKLEQDNAHAQPPPPPRYQAQGR